MATCTCVCLGARTCGFRVGGAWVGERGDAAPAQPSPSQSGCSLRLAIPPYSSSPRPQRRCPCPSREPELCRDHHPQGKGEALPISRVQGLLRSWSREAPQGEAGPSWPVHAGCCGTQGRWARGPPASLSSLWHGLEKCVRLSF